MYRDRFWYDVEAHYARYARQFGRLTVSGGKSVLFSANPDFSNWVRDRYEGGGMNGEITGMWFDEYAELEEYCYRDCLLKPGELEAAIQAKYDEHRRIGLHNAKWLLKAGVRMPYV